MAGNQDSNGPGTDQNANQDQSGAGGSTDQSQNANVDQNAGQNAGRQDQGQGSEGNQDRSATPPVTPPGTGDEPPARVDWRDRRIGELTARNREQRAELERLRAGQAPPNGHQGEQGGDNRQPGAYNGSPPNQAEIDRNVEQRAAILAANQEFNRRCNEAAEAGRRAFGDFDSRVSKLVGLVDNNDPQSVSVYNAFLNAALETGEASRIIHTLGGDLNEASRILSLNPVRMAVELTRLAAKPAQELSQTPRPINPAATNAQATRTSMSPDDPGSDQLSTEEWMRRRNEQISGRGVRR